ncbi:MAG TPA: hypothetical protein VLY24_14860 [Bryobacteraceae bacterium]|nr:hypothetical protein [Bryobacteraceae bacterium]
MPGFFEVTLGGLVGSSLATAVLGALFLRRNKTVEAAIKAQFDESFKVFESKRSWKQQALFELLGPLQMQFERTKRAFDRWDHKNLYLEGKVVREGNQTIHDLLLTKGHLIPPHLMLDACKLVEHYDAWLEAFDRIRSQSSTTSDTAFVFVGPDGYPFPAQAEENFKAEFRKLQQELYGV